MRTCCLEDAADRSREESVSVRPPVESESTIGSGVMPETRRDSK